MKGYIEAEGEEVSEAPNEWVHAAKESGRFGALPLGPSTLPRVHLSLMGLLFHKK